MVSDREAAPALVAEDTAATRHGDSRRPSLAAWTRTRLTEIGLRPSRERGQNFLVDERPLDVVQNAAGLSPADVVLEVGGGLGVLSSRLARTAGHLHVVELDRRLADALDEELGGFENVTLHRADAVRLDFGLLRPVPTKLVANLPYGVAATVVLKALEDLPGMERVVAMVQREVAERLAAAPGSRTYGATSVLAQLASEVEVHGRVPRSAFQPSPNVDSAIVVLRRRGATAEAPVRRFVADAFAHRRKTLAGSLVLARGGDDGLREAVRRELASLGHPADARAERLSPGELEQVARSLERVEAGGAG